MNLDLKSIPGLVTPLLGILKKYAVFIFVVVQLLIFSFLVFRINQFNRLEPRPGEVDDRLQNVTRARIDTKVLDKIQELQDQSIEVKTLFQQARDNPFSECLDKNGQPTTPPNCV